VLLAGAVLLAVLLAGGSSRAMLASARLSCSISRITGYYDPSRLRHAADTPIHPVMFRCPLFISLRDHNPPTLHSDGQPDGRHARSIRTNRKHPRMVAKPAVEIRHGATFGMAYW